MDIFGLGKNKKENQKTQFPDVKGIFEVMGDGRKYINEKTKDADAIQRQFVKEGIRDYITAGRVTFPSGRVRIGDALAYLPAGKFAPELEIRIPVGEYPVDISIIRSESFGLRICTARLKITDKTAVRYEAAMPTKETSCFEDKEGNVLPGFPVDAGVAAFMDAEVCEEYVAFIDKWNTENPDKNYYDDHFAGYFAESAAKYPDYQREGGDFIEWTIPDTEHKNVFFATGYGDGYYKPFWGYSGDNDICELIIPFVDADEIEKAEKGYAQMKKFLPKPDGCIVSKKVYEKSFEVGYLYRDKQMDGVPDSGWRLFAGDEDDEYANNSANLHIAALEYICKYTPKILPLLDSPIGSAYYRDENGEYILEKN